MAALEKAFLVKLTADEEPKEQGQRIPVQFNPASLRLALSNQIEGGAARGRQTRQFNGKSSTDLSFDLHFDTADEANGDQPRSVREKTALVEQFVVPTTEQGSKTRITPPRVRFVWGDLKIDGMISALTLDFDLFAANGMPLRAKMGVSIKEQDARYEIKQKSESQGASDPQSGDQSGGAPGHAGGGPGDATDSTGTAHDGESAADFAARMGLDPSAWRGLAASLGDSLSLAAGVEIDFNSALSASVGLGVSVGVESGVAVSLEASLGLEVAADAALVVGGSLDAQTSAGFALSAAGGMSAALGAVESARANAAASATVGAFAAPVAARGATGAPRATASASAGAQPSRPAPGLQTARPPLRLATASPAQASSVGSQESARDPRISSFGLGVPLRTLVTAAATERAGSLGSRLALRPGMRSGDVPETRDPGTAPWLSLPTDDPSRVQAAAVQLQRRPGKACGCIGPCRSRGGCKCQ